MLTRPDSGAGDGARARVDVLESHNTARSEWANLVKSKSKTEQLNWRGMLSTTNGGILAFRQRRREAMGSSGRAIPAGLQRSFKRYTSGKEIPQSYAMAIARRRAPGIQK